ncbi:hypothetical protein [Streptomyces camelliae]|uniref:Integral membrane protein n=1 Tax=Streptomyces camelliae TaxID=3004093 RepID=A0ABY7P5Z8_9ACTN|nr:hypothetical protein [Streptomyces sp. HUAS 2-6]WBO65993.1 hypothetical protein O1G22_25875 [Streptomyces sp. HUAS 2-6]
MNEPQPSPAKEAQPAGPAGAPSWTKLINIMIAQASFIAALMFYLGVTYTDAYYGYYHLSPFDLGFGFAEFALQSLNLLTFPVLVAVVVLLIAVALNARGSRRVLPDVVARCHLVVVAAGLLLLILWWQWQLLPQYRWAGPLLIGVGLLLGVVPRDDVAPSRGLWDTAVSIFAAGVFLFWAVTLVAGQLGDQHARNDGRHTNRRTALVVYSARRLALFNPALGVGSEDLGNAVHLRYRYTGLRLITARGGRYYALPIKWQARTDPVYILRESDNVRFEFMPGVK